jgi:copper chaperone CopZ
MHCVSRVRKAIEAFEGICDLDVKVGEARFGADENVDVSKIVAAIEDEGYTARIA